MNRNLINPILTSEIWNCEHAFEIECPMKWADLEPTETNRVRHCHSCDQLVHLCETPQEFVDHGNAGRCVAVPEIMVPGRERRAVLGKVSPESMKKSRNQSKDRHNWWLVASSSKPEFNTDGFQYVRTSLRLPRDPELQD